MSFDDYHSLSDEEIRVIRLSEDLAISLDKAENSHLLNEDEKSKLFHKLTEQQKRVIKFLEKKYSVKDRLVDLDALSEAILRYYPKSDEIYMNVTELLQDMKQNPLFPSHLVQNISTYPISKILRDNEYNASNVGRRGYKYIFKNPNHNYPVLMELKEKIAILTEENNRLKEIITLNCKQDEKENQKNESRIETAE